ncbi:MAG: hypothetical protein ACLSA6_08070 [Holdemania massiliensis]
MKRWIWLPVIVWETLPGSMISGRQCHAVCQAAESCVKLPITTGKLMILEGEVSDEMLKKIEAYVINPIESRMGSVEAGD